MVYEIIFNGIGETLGYDFLIIALFLFSFIIMIISRGLGITATLATTLLTTYLFQAKSVADRQLLGTEWFITVLIILGFMTGFMIYSFFLSR